jgi:tyrosine-protein kinase Etk/Wzc
MDQDKTLKAHRAKIAATQRSSRRSRSSSRRRRSKVPFAEEFLSNPTQLEYKQKLAELEVQRIQLLERYTPSDRTVKDVESQIANPEGRAAAEQERILNKQTVRTNELFTELQRNRMSLQTLLADTQAREPSLASRLDASRQRLQDLATSSSRSRTSSRKPSRRSTRTTRTSRSRKRRASPRR